MPSYKIRANQLGLSFFLTNTHDIIEGRTKKREKKKKTIHQYRSIHKKKDFVFPSWIRLDVLMSNYPSKKTRNDPQNCAIICGNADRIMKSLTHEADC